VIWDLQLIGAGTLCGVLVGLAFLVILHNPRAATNRRFGVAILATAGWIITISFAFAAKEPVFTVWLGRLGFAFASVIPFALLWLVDALSDSKSPARTSRLIIPGLASLTFMVISLSPWIVADTTTGLGRPNFIYGPLHRVFGIYFLVCFAAGIYTLWRTIRSVSGLTRLQLRYLLLGISLSGIGAISTNLLIPLVWGTSRYSALGTYFSLIFFSFSAHAIIRHRLMDIRVFIRKGVVYVGAIIAAASVFVFLAEFLRRSAGYEEKSVPLLEALGLALTTAILFQPLKGWLQASLNRYVYRETYNYQRTVRGVSRRLSTILDLHALLDYLASAIGNIFKVEGVFVYLRDDITKTFVLRVPSAMFGTRDGTLNVAIPETSPLLLVLNAGDVCFSREDAQQDQQDKRLREAARELARLGGELAIPLTEDARIVGVIVVAGKKSGDPYFTEDVDLLTTLISQASVAMKNAQLYRQVVLVNEYLDNILSAMESGVIAVDRAGEISLFNPAAERLTGLKSDSVRRSSYHSLPPALALPLRDTLEDGHARPQLETSIHGPDGLLVPLVCSTATLQNRQGSTDGALIVFSDLSRVKYLEREKSRAERLASFGALASGVAHEIKNPLVAIRTFAELLPDRYTESDFREDFSKVVVREIDRIDDLVARLRGIAATPPPQMGAVDIREPISETIALLRARLDQARITVQSRFDDSTPFVAIDESQLKQLFLNLLLNAIEAMSSGGHLTVRITRKDSLGKPWIVVEVSDTGPGIPDSVRPNIFDPFFTTKPRGSGLGLAICRGITDAHRGTIRAENNEDGTGTTITVEFPAVSQAGSFMDHSAVTR
jgi:PAS domain S-box-containing protein